MGQSQSTGNSAAGKGETDNDLYGLLGVHPHATPEELKKAYRNKALELHPDRNYGNAERCTALFADVQAAYDVLSDPQERAWYDSHRETILRQSSQEYGTSSTLVQTEDILKVMVKFSPRMEFSDDVSGFFGAAREIFEQLSRAEVLASRGSDEREPIEYPSFGFKDDDFETVRPFYAVWGGFATRRSFSWKDIHRCSEAPDRRIRRLMETENKRLRDEAIREFNNAVRTLVSFVKKRDPRYKAVVQNETERQKLSKVSAAEQAARSRAANAAKLGDYIVPEWAQEDPADAPFSGESESESLPEETHFECFLCRKTFKSEKQFEVHEKSKKHVKAVKQLKQEMKAGAKQAESGHLAETIDTPTLDNTADTVAKPTNDNA